MLARTRQLFTLILLSVVAGLAVWALLRFTPRLIRRSYSGDISANQTGRSAADSWDAAVEKVKEDRGEPAGGNAAVEVPPELRHYSDRHWFLATQVAEIRKFNVTTCQDFVDLAAMLQRGEMTSVPAVTDNYVLLGVGASADAGVFSKFQDDHSVGLYDEAQLRAEYARIETAAAALKKEISDLQAQSRNLKSRDRASRKEFQKQITSREQSLGAMRSQREVLDQSYGNAAARSQLLADYHQLQILAANFGGRSYNLDDATDREALKTSMLQSLRPQALKTMERIAADYHQQFNRPLPVSSLVRPEQYQHQLHRINRNAVLIDTPPHSTGLAFDIDYRYMSAAEQSFLMSELARLKNDGTIEVIRERNANYHVFVFLDGKRPGDDLIAASLQEVGAPDTEAHHADKAEKKKSAPPRKGRKALTRKRSRHK